MNFSKLQKFISSFVIFLLLLNITVQIPLWNFWVYAWNSDFYNLVSIIVDKTTYENITNKIHRYADDIQNTLENTKVAIFPTPSWTKPFNIASLNEALYFEWYKWVKKSIDFESQLIWTVLIWNLDIPQAYDGNKSDDTILPYTDFEDKMYIYDHKTTKYQKNTGNKNWLKSEIWHWVISPNLWSKKENIQWLKDYFDKNHDFYKWTWNFKFSKGILNWDSKTWVKSDYKPHVFYFDNFREQKSLNYDSYLWYEAYLENKEDINYKRFTKDLAKKIQDKTLWNQKLQMQNMLSDVQKTNKNLDLTWISEWLKNNEDNLKNIPDIQLRHIIEKWPKKFLEIFAKWITWEFRADVHNAGRYNGTWTSVNIDLVPYFVSVLDLVNDEIIKQANNDIEKYIDTLVQNKLSRKIAIPTKTEVIDMWCKTKEYTNFLYWKDANNINSARECSIYRWSTLDDWQLTEANRWLNIKNIKWDTTKCNNIKTSWYWWWNSPLNLDINLINKTWEQNLKSSDPKKSITPIFDISWSKKTEDNLKNPSPLNCLDDNFLLTRKATRNPWSNSCIIDYAVPINWTTANNWSCATNNIENIQNNSFLKIFKKVEQWSSCRDPNDIEINNIVKTKSWNNYKIKFLTRDVNCLPTGWRSYYYKLISSVIKHKSPTYDELVVQTKNMITPNLPVDKNRYIDFISLLGNHTKIDYPYLFRLWVLNNENLNIENIRKNFAKLMQNKSKQINNISNLENPNSLQWIQKDIYDILKKWDYTKTSINLLDFIKTKNNKELTIDQDTKISKYYDTLMLALYWNNLDSISEKYKFIFENYLSDQFTRNENNFILQKNKKLYEIAYLWAEWDAKNMFIKLEAKSKKQNPYADIISKKLELDSKLLWSNIGEGIKNEALFKCSPPGWVPLIEWFPAVKCRIDDILSSNKNSSQKPLPTPLLSGEGINKSPLSWKERGLGGEVKKEAKNNLFISTYNLNNTDSGLETDIWETNLKASDDFNIFLIDDKKNKIDEVKNMINNSSSSKEKLVLSLEKTTKSWQKIPLSYPLSVKLLKKENYNLNKGLKPLAQIVNEELQPLNYMVNKGFQPLANVVNSQKISSINHFTKLFSVKKLWTYIIEITDKYWYKKEKEIELMPLKPTKIELDLWSNIIKTWKSTTNNVFTLLDKFWNITSWELYDVKLNISWDWILLFNKNKRNNVLNKGLKPLVNEEYDPLATNLLATHPLVDKKTLNFSTFEWFSTFKLISTDKEDDNTINFKIFDTSWNELFSQETKIKTIKNINLSISQTPKEHKVWWWKYWFNVSLKDDKWNILKDFNSKIYLIIPQIYWTPSQNYARLKNWEAYLEYKTSNTAKENLQIEFQIEWINKIFTKHIDILPEKPIKIDLSISNSRLEADEDALTYVKAELKDRYWNLVFNDNSTYARLEIKEEYSKIISSRGAVNSGFLRWTAKFKIFATSSPWVAYFRIYTNPSLENNYFVSPSLTLPPGEREKNGNSPSLLGRGLGGGKVYWVWESVWKIETFYFWNKNKIKDKWYNAIYTTLLWSNYGDIKEKDYLAGSLLFDKNNRALAVTSLLNNPYSVNEILNINKNWNITKTYDESDLSQDIGININLKWNNLSLSLFNNSLGTFIWNILYNFGAGADIWTCKTAISDCISKKEKSSIFLKSTLDNYSVSLDNDVLSIKNNSWLTLLEIDKFWKINKFKNTHLKVKNNIKNDYLSINIFDSNTKIWELWLKFVNPFIRYWNTSKSSYKRAYKTNSISILLDSSSYKLRDNKDNISIYYTDFWISVKESSVFSKRYPEWYENFYKKSWLGWKEWNKTLASFSAWKTVWEAVKDYMSFSVINLWDPVISLKKIDKKLPKTNKKRGFDSTVWKLVSNDDNISSYEVFDYDNDSLDDILLIKDDNFLKLLENKKWNFLNKWNLAYITDLWSKDLVKTWDFTNDSYEDIFFVNNAWKPFLLNNEKKDFYRYPLSKQFNLDWKILQAEIFDMNNDWIDDITTLDDAWEINIFYGWWNSFRPVFTKKLVSRWYGLKLTSSNEYGTGSNWLSIRRVFSDINRWFLKSGDIVDVEVYIKNDSGRVITNTKHQEKIKDIFSIDKSSIKIDSDDNLQANVDIPFEGFQINKFSLSPNEEIKISYKMKTKPLSFWYLQVWLFESDELGDDNFWDIIVKANNQNCGWDVTIFRSQSYKTYNKWIKTPTYDKNATKLPKQIEKNAKDDNKNNIPDYIDDLLGNFGLNNDVIKDFAKNLLIDLIKDLNDFSRENETVEQKIDAALLRIDALTMWLSCGFGWWSCIATPLNWAPLAPWSDPTLFWIPIWDWLKVDEWLPIFSALTFATYWPFCWPAIWPPGLLSTWCSWVWAWGRLWVDNASNFIRIFVTPTITWWMWTAICFGWPARVAWYSNFPWFSPLVPWWNCIVMAKPLSICDWDGSEWDVSSVWQANNFWKVGTIDWNFWIINANCSCNIRNTNEKVEKAKGEPIITFGWESSRWWVDVSVDVSWLFDDGDFSDILKIEQKRVLPFPGFLMWWWTSQIEEIINKLTDFPTIFIILPDFSWIFDWNWAKNSGNENVSKNALDSIDDFAFYSKEENKQIKSGIGLAYSFLANIPLVKIENEIINTEVPWIDQTTLNKQITSWQNTLMQRKDELERVKDSRSFGALCNDTKDEKGNIIRTKEQCEEWNKIANRVFTDASALIRSLEKNIEILKSYKKTPEKLNKLFTKRQDYLYQILGYVETISSITWWWIWENWKIFKTWVELYVLIKAILKSWQLIIDVFLDYETQCKECKNERWNLIGFEFKLIDFIIPKIPIISFPKWPDIILDLHNIRAWITISLPEFTISNRPILLPSLPNLILPDLPNINIKLPRLETLPEIVIPELPDLPALPSFKLPHLPPPPKLPDIFGRFEWVLSILKLITKAMCILKTSPFVPEWRAWDQIAFLTERQWYLDFDFFDINMPQFSFPFLDAVKVTSYVNLEAETDFIVEFAKVVTNPFSIFSNNLVPRLNLGVDDLDFSWLSPEDINMDASNDELGSISPLPNPPLTGEGVEQARVSRVWKKEIVELNNSDFKKLVFKNLSSEVVTREPKMDRVIDIWEKTNKLTYSKEDKLINELKETNREKFEIVKSVINTKIIENKKEQSFYKKRWKWKIVELWYFDKTNDIDFYNTKLQEYNIKFKNWKFLYPSPTLPFQERGMLFSSTAKAWGVRGEVSQNGYVQNFNKNKNQKLSKKMDKQEWEIKNKNIEEIKYLSEKIDKLKSRKINNKKEISTKVEMIKSPLSWKERGLGGEVDNWKLLALNTENILQNISQTWSSETNSDYGYNYKWIYITENWKNYRLFDYLSELNWDEKIKSIDYDKDSDEDILYMMNNQIFLKENLIKKANKTYVSTPPIILPPSQNKFFWKNAKFYESLNNVIESWSDDNYININFSSSSNENIHNYRLEFFTIVDKFLNIKNNSYKPKFIKNRIVDTFNDIEKTTFLKDFSDYTLRKNISHISNIWNTKWVKLYTKEFTNIKDDIKNNKVVTLTPWTLLYAWSESFRLTYHSDSETKIKWLYVAKYHNIEIKNKVEITAISGNAYIPWEDIVVLQEDIRKYTWLPLFPWKIIEYEWGNYDTSASSHIDITHYDWTNAYIDFGDTKFYEIYDLWEKQEDYTVRLKTENDFYYSKIRAFDKNMFWTYSRQVLSAPQTESDKNSPELSLDSKIKIPVYQKKKIDLTPHIYESSGVRGIKDVFVDFDVDYDSNHDWNPKNDIDTDKINIIKSSSKIEIEFGKYDSLFDKKIWITLVDNNWNKWYKEVDFMVYSPIPEILSYTGWIINGSMDEDLDFEPVNLYRHRWWSISRLEGRDGKFKVFTNNWDYDFEPKPYIEWLILKKKWNILAYINEFTWKIRLTPPQPSPYRRGGNSSNDFKIRILSSNDKNNDWVYPKIVLRSSWKDIFYESLRIEWQQRVNVVDSFDDIDKDGIYISFSNKAGYDHYSIPEWADYSPWSLSIYRKTDLSRSELFTVFRDGRINTINGFYSIEYGTFWDYVVYKLFDKHFNREVAEVLLKIKGDFVMR
jgi:hypothetical protein